MAFLVVAHVENTLLQHVTESEYDLSNRPSRVKTHKVTKDDAGNITSEHIYTGEVAYDDAFGRLTEFNEKVGATHTAYTTTFGYDEENRPTSLEYGSYGESTIEYDGLGRVAKTTVKAGSGAEASTTYTYVDGAVLETEAPDDADDERKEAAANAAGKTSTTGLVQSITQTGGNFTYTYDDNGNITKVVQDGVTTSYTYDALGQLIQVDDGQENATWVYEYDQGGNILSKKKYALNVTSGTPVESKTFTYGNANWKDQLTAVNGTPITYDNIGNPLNDGTWQYEWVNGRQLARMHSVDTDASFVYNENGLRVRKTVNGVVTDYTLHGKNVVHMTRGNDELHFFYDTQNKPAIVVYNGVPYSYVKNLQGDIVAILDSNKNVVVSYVYDAWGKPISKIGTLASTLGTVQPFRYRGYVYDEETGLYYLRSRYYNVSMARFLNSDSLIISSLGASNLYTYCRNEPLSRKDSSGTVDDKTEEFWRLLETNEKRLRSDRFKFLALSGGNLLVARGYEYLNFYELVNHDGEWDYKRNPPSWISQEDFNMHKSNTRFKVQFVCIPNEDGEWPEDYSMTLEQLGNLNFGYMGTAMGIPADVIFAGGGYAAISGGTASPSDRNTYYDSMEDHRWIAFGILLYQSTHGQPSEVTWSRPEENNIFKDVLDVFME